MAALDRLKGVQTCDLWALCQYLDKTARKIRDAAPMLFASDDEQSLLDKIETGRKLDEQAGQYDERRRLIEEEMERRAEELFDTN